MKTKKGLKEHMKKVHEKVFKHNCPEEDCNFGTQSLQLYKTHRVRHHGEEKEKSYRCRRCKKAFDGENLLKKHLKRKMCRVQKSLPCTLHKPHRYFKTAAGLDRHNKVYHTGDIEKLQCSMCNEWYGSKAAMINHKRWHISLEILARAKRTRLAKEKSLKERGQAAAKAPSRVGVSYSTPARVLPPTRPLMSPERRRRILKRVKKTSYRNVW